MPCSTASATTWPEIRNKEVVDMGLYTFERSKEMFLRATRVIPSGISGNKNPFGW